MNKEIKEILKICNEFLKIPSVTCFENPFLDYLEKKIRKYGYETIRANKYLIVRPKENSSPKYLFSVHIDRHGLIKNKNEDVEYLAYYFKKKFKLKFKKDNYEFYLGAAQRHTKEEIVSYDEISGKLLNKYRTLRYNIDWKEKLVTFDLNKSIKSVDKIFMFKSKVDLINNLFYGQIDNVISAAVLFYLLKTINFKQEIIFTTQEEIGRSYLDVNDYLTRTRKKREIITLDTTPYQNFNEKEDGFLVLRKGDENGKFNLELVNKIENLLKQENCPIYFKSSNLGMTELGRISSESKGKFNGATLQIPTMNYHTTYETSTITSLENYLKIIRKLSN